MLPPTHPVNRGLRALLASLVLLSLSGPGADAQERARLTFQDLMKVRQIQSPAISPDGRWVALAAVPDRGDGEVLVREADGDRSWSVPRGAGPVFSADGAWVGTSVESSVEDQETAPRGRAPRAGMALLSTATGEVLQWDEIQRFAFSGDGLWLARQAHAPRAEPGSPPADTGQAAEGRRRESPGTLLVLRELASGLEEEIAHVRSFSFDEEGRRLAYVVAAPDGEGDGVYVRTLEPGASATGLELRPFVQVGSLAWWEEGARLAWVAADEDEDGVAGPGTLSFWDGDGTRVALAPDALPPGWTLPVENRLRWSQDGERLFYGTRPLNQAEAARSAGGGEEEAAAEENAPFDPYDVETILEGRTVEVWHTDDPMILPNQERSWSRLQSRTFMGVYHVPDGRAVQLGDTLAQLQGVPENPRRALATSSVSYQKESTWTGGADDLYLVSMDTGERTLVAKGLQGGGSTATGWVGVSAPTRSLSPGGRYLAWFQDDDWHLHDARTGTTRNLTRGMDVTFWDEDHDTPDPRGAHGVGGWLEDDAAVLIHDRYDVWQFPTAGGEPINLTGGRGRVDRLILRVLDVDPEREAYAPGDPIHLAGFAEGDKSFGFYRTRATRGGLDTLLEEEKRFSLVSKAERAPRVLYTREAYDEFPDLWVAGMDFSQPRKVTDVNPGLLDRFAWGSARLVEWTSDDGVPLQGVVILPGNYEEGKRYPVLTYFYELFSQRLHEFNQPVVNHRPSFPIYASDGYIVFLPDVRFEIGRPGLSSVKCVVPGVKKLVDMGLADPESLGLHGHSWSGYTTAFIVTQTDIFAAAVAGAPVSNMTSAYGGIRWGTGLARQFQYEMGQSRLSGSLWEAPMEYIENSPLFYADRIRTPLVLMHGDEDDAVPWYQSIELYLALRRLGKPSVFLQYGGEPHHPRLYGNKLDYSIRMKAFFDHYLKGGPAPDWWVEGVPYSGG